MSTSVSEIVKEASLGQDAYPLGSETKFLSKPDLALVKVNLTIG